MSDEHQVTVHRFEASLFPVNAYLVETRIGIVVVDATLGVSDGRALRARVDALRKPLAAVLITHSHPDHYGGLRSLLDGTDVPVYAVAGVDEVIRRDDSAKRADPPTDVWRGVGLHPHISKPRRSWRRACFYC
jgi:glyoxylase-like metal-dependent hydrolase (beta-lactamase superfamily II)